MKTHIVIDGNAFYEVDEECMEEAGRGKQEKYRKERGMQDIKKRIDNSEREDHSLKK